MNLIRVLREYSYLRRRVRELEQIMAEAREYDAKLDEEERAPNGDDYNALLSILGV